MEFLFDQQFLLTVYCASIKRIYLCVLYVAFCALISLSIPENSYNLYLLYYEDIQPVFRAHRIASVTITYTHMYKFFDVDIFICVRMNESELMSRFELLQRYFDGQATSDMQSHSNRVFTHLQFNTQHTMYVAASTNSKHRNYS